MEVTMTPALEAQIERIADFLHITDNMAAQIACAAVVKAMQQGDMLRLRRLVPDMKSKGLVNMYVDDKYRIIDLTEPQEN